MAEEESLMGKRTANTGDKAPRIVRGRVDSLSIYEITEDELRTLEQGSPSSTYFNFAIALLSTALSFITVLTTTSIPSGKLFTVFVVITVVGFALGSFLLILWCRTKSSVRVIVDRIKQRIRQEESADESVTTGAATPGDSAASPSDSAGEESES
jgi:hypothetical protein